jgi:hypothetical protein
MKYICISPWNQIDIDGDFDVMVTKTYNTLLQF